MTKVNRLINVNLAIQRFRRHPNTAAATRFALCAGRSLAQGHSLHPVSMRLAAHIAIAALPSLCIKDSLLHHPSSLRKQRVAAQKEFLVRGSPTLKEVSFVLRILQRAQKFSIRSHVARDEFSISNSPCAHKKASPFKARPS
jgi:hypothetical protein